MKRNILITGLLASQVLLYSASISSSETSSTKELQQLMVFDQACITMHEEGRKYLKNKEKITHSYGAAALIERRLEERLQKYSQATGDTVPAIRNMISGKGAKLFKELSQYQPRDLVSQCGELVERIVQSNL